MKGVSNLRLTVDNVNMIYHTISSETAALKDISFSVEENDFVSIVGPSGCGKSTLLNIISGLQKPSSGSVYIDDTLICDSSHMLGYMFQKDHLFDWLTVWKNIALGLKIQKNKDSYNIKLAEELLKKYDLWQFKDMLPRQLSGGMRQRVALIRTLILNPQILLLDEPFSALDYQTRLNISDEIYQIIKNENKTVIMVTHDISEAVSLSNKIVILSSRPAKISKVIDIRFPAEYSTPLKKREAPNFKDYFNIIWKELNTNE